MLKTALIAASFAATATLAAAAEPAESFPAAFFAPSQPSSARDMIARLPGFTFDGGDNEVRGLSGAGGNVLVDGKRPPSKQEPLDVILRRIPAQAVARIELIRAGAPGVDMQGHAVLANVVRAGGANLRGRVEAELILDRAGHGPGLATEITRRSGERQLELSAATRRESDDETGSGPLRRFDASGALSRDSRYRQDQATTTSEAAAGYESPLAGGALRADLSVRRAATRADILEVRTFPTTSAEQVREAERIVEGELALRYDRKLGGGWSAEGRLLHHGLGLQAADLEVEADSSSASEVRSEAQETIVQGIVRRAGAKTNLEAGMEASFNLLDSRSSLVEDGALVPLPAAMVRVEERRAEGFATATWTISPHLSLEAGSRLEFSRLSQSGDSRLEKTFAYLKPRLLVAWSPAGPDRLRLEVVRLVGQLDFEDFVSSASLTSDQITAGNPDLEPDRTWRLSATWERKVGRAGSVVVTARRDYIEDVVDRVPVVGVGSVFDAPGNIGEGRRTELQLGAKLALDGFRIPGGLLTADLIWRRSRVTDPATGARRQISDEPNVEGAIAFTQDLPAWRLRWGVEAELGETEYEYRFDEVERERVETRYAMFAEVRPVDAWTVRVFAENLTNARVIRRRAIYDGMRGAAALRHVDVRDLAFGAYAGVRIQRSFGR